MRKLFFLGILIFTCFKNGFAQAEFDKLQSDSLFYWKTDRFYIQEYVLTNHSDSSMQIQFLDSIDSISSYSIKYSLNNNFFEKKEFWMPKGKSVLRIWISPEQLKNFNYDIYLTDADSSYFYQTTFYTDENKKESIANLRITDWIDFYSKNKEKTELQLYDKAWKLISTFDSYQDRISMKNFEAGKYFLKINKHIYGIEKVDLKYKSPLPTTTY